MRVNALPVCCSMQRTIAAELLLDLHQVRSTDDSDGDMLQRGAVAAKRELKIGSRESAAPSHPRLHRKLTLRSS